MVKPESYYLTLKEKKRQHVNATICKVKPIVKDWFLENYPNHKEMIAAAAPKRAAQAAGFSGVGVGYTFGKSKNELPLSLLPPPLPLQKHF